MLCRSVLLVENELDISDPIRELLQSEGYQVFVASNGKEALDLLATLPELPGIIFVDLSMPILGGREFLKQRSKRPELLDTPVVVFSAATQAGIQEELLALGAESFMRKPFEIETLLSLVHRFCGEIRLRPTPHP